MVNLAFLFPGQGSQYVGMGKELYEKYDEVKTLFDEADNLLNFSISNLCFNGPLETLTATSNVQPAIFLLSAAVYTLLSKNGLCPDTVAGHSVGQYSALFSAESLTFKDALLLVRKRGEFMGSGIIGTMAAVIGLTNEEVTDICKSTGLIAEPANFNASGQIVISGSNEGIAKALEILKTKGRGKGIPLNVSGPFHSSLMKPAQEKLASYIDNTNIKTPKPKFVDNVTADYVENTEEIRNNLKEQVIKPVLWEASMKKIIASGIDMFVEVGSGKVLSGLIKRIDKSVSVYNVEDSKSLEEILKAVEKIKV